MTLQVSQQYHFLRFELVRGGEESLPGEERRRGAEVPYGPLSPSSLLLLILSGPILTIAATPAAHLIRRHQDLTLSPIRPQRRTQNLSSVTTFWGAQYIIV